MARSISPFERLAVALPLDDAGVVEHIVVEGETLSGIAHRYYEDWRRWPEIADYNSVADPRHVPAGTRLLIPPAALEQGAFESF